MLTCIKNLINEAAIERSNATIVDEPQHTTIVDTTIVDPQQRLDPHDRACWTDFLATVRVGGALPVTFRPDGDHVIVDVIVPYVPPETQDPAEPNKIPIRIAAGFPVPISARYKLPAYTDTASAADFVRLIIRGIYLHEIDEQLHVGDRRPFAPGH